MRRLQVDTFAVSGGTWRLSKWAPSPDLSDAVESLWAVESSLAGFREHVVPRENVELMINLGGRQLVHDPAGRTQAFRHSWVFGLQTSFLDVESPETPRLFVASLRPAHAAAVLGVSGTEIAGRVLPLDELIGGHAESLAARMEASPCDEARFRILEDFIRQRRTAFRAGNPTAIRAIVRIMARGGQVAIGAMAREFGCSARYLETRVGELAGLSPKQLARVIRFTRAVEAVRTAAHVDWTRIAHSAGFFDQSHLNKEWRLLTGVGPSEFLDRRDPSSQAVVVT
ncbi:MAG: AraC family transcriptional regulator [Acidobacteria bacterium]|nr:AraC family transcriptional regulator [Acidobacteriota bacterium]